MTAEHKILTTRLRELLATPSDELTETEGKVKEEILAALSLGFRKIDDDAIGESLTG
ncbi:MAG TPA: hypothetical protein VN956_04360 [Pyrinomonadaceae bacterium]|nr:hypothetical protein [Pyrinomonadaceae bacterium]